MMTQIAAVRVDPARAQVYAEGWQSWSQTGSFPARTGDPSRTRHAAMTGVEAYRHGLRLIRDAIGPDALLVGCGAPILPSAGLVDAMRVGPDIAADYEPPGGQPTMPSQRNAVRNVVARAWQQGRFWVNDPDCLMLRPQVQRRSEWAAVVERYGGLRSCGDGLRQLDDWGLATTRRLLIDSPVKPVALTTPPGSPSSASARLHPQRRFRVYC